MTSVGCGTSLKFSFQGSQGLYEQKQYKTWFDEGYSQFLDERKWTKLQWLQDKPK